MKLNKVRLGAYNGPWLGFPGEPVKVFTMLSKAEAEKVRSHLENVKGSSEATVFYRHGETGHLNREVRSCTILHVDDDFRKWADDTILEGVRPWIQGQLRQPNYKIQGHLQFIKYTVRDDGAQDHFTWHADSAIQTNRGWNVNTPERHLTLCCYVNDEFEGGQFQFQNVSGYDGNILTITPEVGMTLLFPSDPRFVHRVLPVTKGVRYAIVGWFTLLP